MQLVNSVFHRIPKWPWLRIGIVRLLRLINRFPWVIAIFGFGSGVASYLFVEREQELFAQIVSALMLISWVWLALENLLRRGVLSWFGFELPPPLLSFITQLVHQESLFFVIPFFLITTSWDTGQPFFTALLIAGAIISIIDPIYYRWLAPRRWLYFIFHSMTLFAVLLTALPIIFRLPTPQTYLYAWGLATLLALPGIIRSLRVSWWKRSLLLVLLVGMIGGAGWLVRPYIPSAALRLTHAVVTDGIDMENRSPKNRLHVLASSQLKNGLYAYTAIRAPRGLNERIVHVWRLNGREVDRIPLNIAGGREEGYRAWSRKLNFPSDPTGQWQVHVVTEADQVIGIIRFRVVN